MQLHVGILYLGRFSNTNVHLLFIRACASGPATSQPENEIFIACAARAEVLGTGTRYRCGAGLAIER